MPNQAAARALEPDIVSRLARFFPDASPVRIPIKLSRTQNRVNGNGNSNGSGNGNGNGDLTAHEHESENVFFQDTVIEFGTPHGLSEENGIKLLGEQVLPALRGKT